MFFHWPSDNFFKHFLSMLCHQHTFDLCYFYLQFVFSITDMSDDIFKQPRLILKATSFIKIIGHALGQLKVMCTAQFMGQYMWWPTAYSDTFFFFFFKTKTYVVSLLFKLEMFCAVWPKLVMVWRTHEQRLSLSTEMNRNMKCHIFLMWTNGHLFQSLSLYSVI